MLKNGMVSNTELPFKIDHTLDHAKDDLADRLRAYVQGSQGRPIVIVCIGTDRSTGDSLGPLVGSRLVSLIDSDVYPVYGTLESPVHAVNLKETVELIYQEHMNPFVIAIDACLGQLQSVGMVTLGEGPVKPGAGVNKELPAVGDIHLTGIVNVGGFMEYFVLQNTRLSIVIKMAETIAQSIALSLQIPVSAPKRIPRIQFVSADAQHTRIK